MMTAKFQTYILEKGLTISFLTKLSEDYCVYIPLKDNDAVHFGFFDSDKKQAIELDGMHAVEPLKSFFFPPLEIIGNYFSTKQYSTTEQDAKPLAIVGAKSYDVESLHIFDKIFGEGDFQDPTYIKMRETSLIITNDCTTFSDACFSPLVGVKLYPEKYFDLSLARVKGGYVVSVGSEKGQNIISANPAFFKLAPAGKITERDANRAKLQKEIEKQSAQYKLDIPYEQLLRKETDSHAWLEATKTCVECGACVLVCPTCYCFILTDKKSAEGYERIRTWDTCQYKGFAKVAGGSNPRPRLAERLRHRYLHKFDYLKESCDVYACTGCGRCVQACMGKIDMRKVFVAVAAAAKQGAASKSGA
jgi:sulfhydrogenase subunit beta (sulfur reductase)